MRKGYYLKYWVKLLAVILEKGKGPIIGKLQTIQIIGADLQLLIRIFIEGRVENAIKMIREYLNLIMVHIPTIQ